MKSDLIVGLDIGTTKVCTLVAEIDGTGTLSLLGSGIAPCGGLRRGAVVDVDRTVEAILSSVESVQKATGIEIVSALVGVTGEHIASLNSKGVVAVKHPDGQVRRGDMDRVLESARLVVLPPERQIVQVVPRGYSLDGQDGITNPLGMCGSRLEVEAHVITGAEAFLRNIAVCVERAGLQIDALLLEPVVSGEAILLPAERELGVAVLDIGGGTTDIALFQGGEVCHTAVVPIGGELVTRDMAAFLRSTLEEAERVKRSDGHCWLASASASTTVAYAPLGSESATELITQHDLTEVIEARCSELFQMAKRELVRSGFWERLPAGVVLTGGGALLSGIEQLAHETLELPTRIGSVRLGTNRPAQFSMPTFATAVGLVQWGQRHGLFARDPRENGSLLRGFRSWLRRTTRAL